MRLKCSALETSLQAARGELTAHDACLTAGKLTVFMKMGCKAPGSAAQVAVEVRTAIGTMQSKKVGFAARS